MKKYILLLILCISQLNSSLVLADSSPCIAMKLSTGKKVRVDRYEQITQLLETLAAKHTEVLNDLYQTIKSTRKKTRCYARWTEMDTLEKFIEILTGDKYFLWDNTETIYPDVRYIIIACCKQQEDGTIEIIKQ